MSGIHQDEFDDCMEMARTLPGATRERAISGKPTSTSIDRCASVPPSPKS